MSTRIKIAVLLTQAGMRSIPRCIDQRSWVRRRLETVDILSVKRHASTTLLLVIGRIVRTNIEPATNVSR